MRITYYFTTFNPSCYMALPLGSEAAYTGEDDRHYWRQLMLRWWDYRDIMIVEHDIKIHSDVIQQFYECESEWCVFPYNGLTESLGCTRLRKSLRKKVLPLEFLDARAFIPGVNLRAAVACDDCNLSGVCWRHLDLRIAGTLRLRSFSPCVHSPDVQHR